MYISITYAGIIFGGDIERFAHFSAKNLIEISLLGENLVAKSNLAKCLLNFLS